jgi:hypothetical protein
MIDSKKVYQNRDLLGLAIDSIRANAVSLWGQLNDYDFLYLTIDEAAKLNKIEIELHDLVKQIVDRQPAPAAQEEGEG